MRKEVIGAATLYLADCREVLPTLAKVGAIVTDPPYGLGDKWQGGKAHTKARWKLNDGGGNMGWDAKTHDAVPGLPALADQCIVWGGHLYALPPARGWLVWDKIVRNFTSGHCELAWTTLDQPVRAFNYAHGELASEGKFHPTQKPVPLMTWCIAMTSGEVLDPFMGGGSTGVACMGLERPFVGIEVDPRYFDIACRRIEDAQRQARMFG